MKLCHHFMKGAEYLIVDAMMVFVQQVNIAQMKTVQDLGLILHADCAFGDNTKYSHSHP